MTLTTGFDDDVALPMLEALGWHTGPDGILDAVVTTSDVTAGRPAPYMIHHAMELTGVTDVHRVLAAGDTIVDLLAARNAGAITVGVTTGALSRDARPWLRPFRGPGIDGFSCRAVMLRPQSRGQVEIASADPADPPRIHFDFLQTEDDRETLRAGLRLIRRLATQPSLASFIRRELAPGPSVVSDDDLDAHIRASSGTSNHPAGTCRMGPGDDPMAVVDAGLRVRGVERLRVVDASVMPAIVSGNTVAATYCLAERGADLVKAEARDGVVAAA